MAALVTQVRLQMYMWLCVHVRLSEVQVWTLPGLEPMKVFSLSSCLGFPSGWQGEPSKLPLMQRMCSLGADGRMDLAGPCNEVVTLTLLSGTDPMTGTMHGHPLECC